MNRFQWLHRDNQVWLDVTPKCKCGKKHPSKMLECTQPWYLDGLALSFTDRPPPHSLCLSNTQMYTHTRIHTETHTHTNAHTHTHSQALTSTHTHVFTRAVRSIFANSTSRINCGGMGSISSTCLHKAFTPADPKKAKSCLTWLSFLRFWDLRT